MVLLQGDERIYRIKLDPNQYVTDAFNERDGEADVYADGWLNVVVRRQGRANNFKAVLETIRDLIRGGEVVAPAWLHGVSGILLIANINQLVSIRAPISAK
jgi:hypothetical protein